MRPIRNTVANLTYTNNGHGLTTSGNAVTVTHSQTATRTLSTTVGTNNTTLWASYELNCNGTQDMMIVGTINNGLEFGRIDKFATWQVSAQGATGSHTELLSGMIASNNTTYFLVVKIQYLNTGDVVDHLGQPAAGRHEPDQLRRPRN